MNKDSKIVVTGGGSGGHTITALAVVDEMVKRNPDIEKNIDYIGGNLSMEGEKDKPSLEEKFAKEKGLNFIRIRSGKLQRQFSFRTIKLLFGVIGGIIDSFKYFNKNKVSLVFSSGGYVTVPVCFVAWLKKIPVVVHEQTTRAGLSNRINARFAKSVLVAYEESKKLFPRHKVKFTGNTVRECFFDTSSCTQGLRNRINRFKRRSEKYPVIMISGGGQGSHILNEMVRQALRFLISNYQLIIITGDNRVYRDYDKIKRSLQLLSKQHRSRVILSKFYGEEIGLYLEAADLYVGRGGAMSCYEVGVTSTPSIIIPIPWVQKNEQYHNAEVLEEIGLAKILQEGVLSPEILVQEIDKMIEKIRNNELDVNEKKKNKYFVRDGAEKIVNELENFVEI